MDRLSELPDSLIEDILSMLPTRDAVCTSVLSKRWKDVWTRIPCLNFLSQYSEDEFSSTNRVRPLYEPSKVFKYREYREELVRMLSFAKGALALWKGDTILKFRLTCCNLIKPREFIVIDSWISFAVEKRVEELCVPCEPRSMLRLISCPSIKKLSIMGYNLFREWFKKDEFVIEQVVEGAPQLEVFEFEFPRSLEKHEDLSIRSTSLKHLKIVKYTKFGDPESHRTTMLTICCPALVTLQCHGVLYPNCLFTTFEYLTDATLMFIDYHHSYYDHHSFGIVSFRETMRQIFKATPLVENLTLSHCSVQGLWLQKHLISPLSNVRSLECGVVEYGEMMLNILGIFPNLNKLVIRGVNGTEEIVWIDLKEVKEWLENADHSDSFPPQLKIVEIGADHEFKPTLFQVIEFLLKHANVLQRLVVKIIPRQHYQLSKIVNTISGMPISSSTAEVVIHKT